MRSGRGREGKKIRRKVTTEQSDRYGRLDGVPCWSAVSGLTAQTFQKTLQNRLFGQEMAAFKSPIGKGFGRIVERERLLSVKSLVWSA